MKKIDDKLTKFFWRVCYVFKKNMICSLFDHKRDCNKSLPVFWLNEHVLFIRNTIVGLRVHLMDLKHIKSIYKSGT